MSSSSPTTGATTRSSSSSSKTSSPPQDSGRPFLFPSTPGSSGSGFVPMEFQDVSSPSKNAKGTSKPPSRVLHKPPAAAAAAPEPDPPGNKRRSSRAIKRKKFDDEIIDSPSLLPPPSPLNVASSGPGPLNILPAATSAASSPGSPALSSPSTPVGHGTLSGGTPTGKLGPPPPGGPSSSGSPSGIPPLLGQGANGKGMGKIIRSRTTSASKSK